MTERRTDVTLLSGGQVFTLVERRGRISSAQCAETDKPRWWR